MTQTPIITACVYACVREHAGGAAMQCQTPTDTADSHGCSVITAQNVSVFLSWKLALSRHANTITTLHTAQQHTPTTHITSLAKATTAALNTCDFALASETVCRTIAMFST